MNVKIAGAAVAALTVLSLAAGFALRSRPAAGGGAPVVEPRAAHDSSRISPGELRAMAGRGEVLIVDVRDAESYIVAHIEGALHIPLAYIESEAPYLRRGKRLITYCT